MADSELHKVVIGDLLNKADFMAKKVVSAYNADVLYNTNLQNLKKFDATHLEATATFLGFTVRGEENKKLYKNLKVLCDRIILKIESLFETGCNDCGETYRNKLEDTPLLTCQLCNQGSHNCAKIQERFDALNEVPETLRLIGMVWLCFGCLKKNNLAFTLPTNPSDPPSNRESDEDDPEPPAETEGERVSPRRNRENQPEIRSEICAAYKARNCPHGLTGKKLINGIPCDKKHPPRCFRYCKHGDNKRLGCVKGRDCKYFHPKLCRDSVTKRECLNKDCNFNHLKFTRRRKEEVHKDSIQVTKKATGRKMRFDSVASLTTPYPPTVNQTYASVSRHAQPAAVEEPNSFLLQLLENMKEGIICQVSEKIADLQSSLPSMVQEQLRQSVPFTQRMLPAQPLQSMTCPQTAQLPHTQSFPAQYPGYFC